jgi:GntR family transcriptional regulator
MHIVRLQPQDAVVLSGRPSAKSSAFRGILMTVSEEPKRPRYLQVRDELVGRIQSGMWAPGQLIPSEIELAREFKVSQGTARSAVNALAMENILVRRQGLGTFVYEHTQEEELARFFRVFDDMRERVHAESRGSRLVEQRASPTERRELHIASDAKVLRLRRVRLRNSSPFALETISLPASRFPDLGRHEPLPCALYELYQKHYGVLVVSAEERLTAGLADRAAAKALDIESGAPLLRIERVAFALDGTPVEWRVSLYHLVDAHYLPRLA